ncbi:hypothetical protein ACSBR1_006375 [Camellia fascicularis]
MDKEISSGSNEDCDKIDIETEIEETKNVEVEIEIEIEDPKVGMTFKSSDEIYEYYSRYGKRNGIADDGEKIYITIASTSARKAKIKTSNIVKLRPQTKTRCKAGLNANLQADGMWILRSLRLEHNHEISPSKSHFFKQNRILEPHVKRRLELNNSAGIRMNKNFTSLVLEARGHEKLSYLEKDCRNHIDKVRHLDEDGRLLNVFWADPRNRAASKKFGDVVTFDTIYLRSESMHAFFDGYINSKTTLKQFVEQYENALAKKVENENGEEFNSLNSYIPCITQYPFEKQFQIAYTIAKFKEFQQEIVGHLHCNLSLYTQGPDFSIYEVKMFHLERTFD